MYNIVKTCKAEILPYFNEVFDAIAKVRSCHSLLELQTVEHWRMMLIS